MTVHWFGKVCAFVCSRRENTQKYIPILLLSFLLFPTQNVMASGSTPAPEFKLPGIASPVALQDYRGHYLYVDFWASWCGPCRQSFPWMNDMQARYQAQGLKIIAINLDEKRSDADQFLNEIKADVDIAFDASGKTAQAFDVRGMPSSYLINPDGEIVFSHIGFRKRDTAKLEAVIASLMGGA